MAHPRIMAIGAQKERIELVHKLMYYVNMAHRRKYPLVHSLPFDDLKSDWHAYWLGFFAADGSIGGGQENKPNVLRLNISGIDASHLFNLRRGLKAKNRISLTQYGHYTQASIVFYDKPLVERLSVWGILPDKSTNRPFPNVPRHLMNAYIRGYFDGDGTLYKRSNRPEVVARFTSCNRSYLERLSIELGMAGIKTLPMRYGSTSSTHILPVSTAKQNLKNLADFMYAGATVYLDRKRSIFKWVGHETP